MKFNGNLKIISSLLILTIIILFGVGYTINITQNNIENNLDLIQPEEIDWSSQKLYEAKDYAKEIGSAVDICFNFSMNILLKTWCNRFIVKR